MRSHRFPVWLRITSGIVAALLVTIAWQIRENLFITGVFSIVALCAFILALIDILPLLQRMDEAGWMRAFAFYRAMRHEERRIALARAMPPVFLDRMCGACIVPVHEGALFCYHCGAPINAGKFKFCYHCEKTVPLEARFCPYCRFPVGEYQTNSLHLIDCVADALEQRPLLHLVSEPEASGNSAGEHATPPDWLIGIQPHLKPFAHITRTLETPSSVWEALGVETSAPEEDTLLEQTEKYAAVKEPV